MPRIPKTPSAFSTSSNSKYNKNDLKRMQELQNSMNSNTDLLLEVPEEFDDEEIEIYCELIILLFQANVPVCDLDRPMIILATRALKNMNECDRIIKQFGRYIQTCDKNGNAILKANPAVADFIKFSAVFDKAASKLGLSVVARSNIVSKSVLNNEDDDWDY